MVNYVNATLLCSYPPGGAAGAQYRPSVDGQIYVPYESDLSIQNPGDAWFYHKGHVYDSSADLWAKYLATAGRGSTFILNVPPDTSGLVPEMDRLGAHFEGRVGLAISLHQANDAKRSALMPINDRYPLKDLMASLRRYPLRRRRNITIEYTLVAGQNDSIEDARALSGLLSKLRVKVNLIPMNRIVHSALGPPADRQVSRFQDVLRDAGVLCFIRRRRGDDVAAACGQLALEGAEPNVRFLRRQPEE